jgi:hypothetical protein
MDYAQYTAPSGDQELRMLAIQKTIASLPQEFALSWFRKATPLFLNILSLFHESRSDTKSVREGGLRRYSREFIPQQK